jgi:hypothetical protein
MDRSVKGCGVAAEPKKGRSARRWIALAAAVLTAGSVLSIVAGVTGAQAKVSPGATSRASVHDDGSQVDGPQFARSRISADGQFVAFSTDAPIDPLDATNDAEGQDDDIYVRDLTDGHTILITRSKERRGEGDDPRIVEAPSMSTSAIGTRTATASSTSGSTSRAPRTTAP